MLSKSDTEESHIIIWLILPNHEIINWMKEIRWVKIGDHIEVSYSSMQGMRMTNKESKRHSTLMSSRTIYGNRSRVTMQGMRMRNKESKRHKLSLNSSALSEVSTLYYSSSFPALWIYIYSHKFSLTSSVLSENRSRVIMQGIRMRNKESKRCTAKTSNWGCLPDFPPY
jgi:hypothetical protein